MYFDYVGIVMFDVVGLVVLFVELFDVFVVYEEMFDGMLVVFFEFENGYFELFEFYEEGVILKFFDKCGGGIYYVVVEIDDIEVVFWIVEVVGVDCIDEELCFGVWGYEVVFLYFKFMGGVFVEFVLY